VGKNSANLSAIAAIGTSDVLFITVEGVEPTNAAERAVLPCCGDAPVSVLRAKQEVSL